MRASVFLAAAVALAVSFGTAEATPITEQFASTVSFTTTNTQKLTFASSGLNTTLTLGVDDIINNFITVTVASGTSSDTNGTVTANFTFTAPSAAMMDSGTIAGGQVNGGSGGSLAITWPNQPTEFDFSDGTVLDVALANFSTSCSSNNCLSTGGNGNGTYNIGATFTLRSASTPVPEPLTLSLFGAGLAGMVALGRRKRLQTA